MKGPLEAMRVLHSVDNYLSLSENWIYPQIVRVPNVTASVFCKTVTNLEMFPVKRSAVIAAPPPWNSSLGIPRVFDGVSRRLGWRNASATLRIAWCRPQILHAHFGTRGWTSLALRRRLGIPLITSFYGYDAWRLPVSTPIWRQRYHELFANGDAFLVEGPAMRERLVDLGCAPAKIVIQRIGVDLAALPYERKNLTGGLRVAMVGRFVEKKGMVDGLRACALARSRGVNLSVTIVGDATDTPGQRIKSELQAIAGSPELAGYVQFAGFLPMEQTRAVIGRCNVFMSPSKHAANGDAEGGSPVALTEAMAMGLLCIGTRHCDIPEVIVDRRTGYLCNEGDIEGMADVLSSVANCPDQRTTLTEAGRKHIEQSFALDTQMNLVRSFYELVLAESSKGAWSSSNAARLKNSLSSQFN